MRRLIFILLFGLTFIQNIDCQNQIDSLLIVRTDINNVGPVKMSEVFSEIRYIPLETKPECLLNNISVSEYEDFFLVSSNDAMESIFLYSKEGMFLRKIGNKGRGPGEYIDRKDVKIIDNKVFVVSNFSRSIITYSIDGKFIKKYNLGFGGLPGSITKITDHSFFISLTNTCDLGRLILTDEDLVPINGFFKQNPIRYTPNPLSFPISNNKTYYYYSVVDTIFEITGDKSSLQYYRKEKVLTIVGAFFCAQRTLSVLSRNHRPESARIYLSCFKSKNEIEQLQGLTWIIAALRTALIKHNRR
ncbi:MAG: 6-bladed beta-propeller [Bacteroidales bacterium]